MDPRTRRDATAASPARRRTLWLVAAGVLVVIVVITIVASFATDASGFCGTCHEMRPYLVAWYAGGHHGRAECVDCHVDPGTIAQLVHKPFALTEVWAHFFGNSRFPLPKPPGVPDARCSRCHPAVADRPGSRFSHSYHVIRAPCQECHSTTGHQVSLGALGTEGVLSPVPVSTPAGVHISTPCSRCHRDMATACSRCHTPPHSPRGACERCHQPGPRWVFAHPHDTACQDCHTAPAGHFGPPCMRCHTPAVPFAQTTFQHPPVREHGIGQLPCTACHPNGYATVSCTCHGGGIPRGD